MAKHKRIKLSEPSKWQNKWASKDQRLKRQNKSTSTYLKLYNGKIHENQVIWRFKMTKQMSIEVYKAKQEPHKVTRGQTMSRWLAASSLSFPAGMANKTVPAGCVRGGDQSRAPGNASGWRGIVARRWTAAKYRVITVCLCGKTSLCMF